MSKMGEFAAERQQNEEPEQKVTRCIVTIYTTDGREWESVVQKLDEKKLLKWNDAIGDMKNLGHVYFSVSDALGRKSTMHFHPDKIVAIRFTEETL